MKLILMIFGALYAISYLKCASSSNLLGGLTNTLSGALNKVTKITTSNASPVLNTGTCSLGNEVEGLAGALGSVGSLLGGTLGSVGKATGSLVQTVGGVAGGVAGGLVNAAGYLLEGVIGLTQEVLNSLKFFKKDSIPLYHNPINAAVFECFENVARKFQLLYPESTRVASNMDQIAVYFGGFHNYCINRSTETEVLKCLDILRETGANKFNTFNIDLVSVNIDKAAQWGTTTQDEFMKCYIMPF